MLCTGVYLPIQSHYKESILSYRTTLDVIVMREEAHAGKGVVVPVVEQGIYILDKGRACRISSSFFWYVPPPCPKYLVACGYTCFQGLDHRPLVS